MITLVYTMKGLSLAGTSMWAGPIGAFTREFCFAPDTELVMDDGNIKKMMDIEIGDVLENCGVANTVHFLDNIKDIGFKMAFKAGLSFNLGDVIVPAEKEELINQANEQVDEIRSNYSMGFITNNERYNQVIDVWTTTNARLTDTVMKNILYGNDTISEKD